MAEVVNRQVNVFINSGEAQKALDALIAKEKRLNEELTKTSDPKKIKALNAELAKMQEPIDRARKKLSGELLPTFRDLEAATRKWLNEFKRTGDAEALANFKKFNAQLQQAKADINGLEAAQSGLTKSGIFSGSFWGNLAAGGITAASSALSNFFTSSIEEALNADAATKRLEATLQNLGREGAITRITYQAEQLAEQFRYLDNDDIVGVFNRLIDYGKLTEQEMNKLLPVIIDFAAKSQISIDESAGVIIKALEGNGKALKEYGIDIKDAGTETERLNVIMTTLKEKVDGSAQAFQDSAAGGIAEAKQQFANLKEEIGNGLLPVLNTTLDYFNKWLIGIKTIFGEAKEFISDVFSEAFMTQEQIFRKRIKEAQEAEQKLIERTAKSYVASFSGKSTLEVGEEIIRLQLEIAASQKILDNAEKLGKRSSFSPEELNRRASAIKLFRLELQGLFDLQANAGQTLGLDAGNDKVKPITKKTEVKKLTENFLLRNILFEEADFDKISAEINKQVADLTKIAQDAATDFDKKMRDITAKQQGIFSLLGGDLLAGRDLAIGNARGLNKLNLQKQKLKDEQQAEEEALKQKAARLGLGEENIQNLLAQIRQKYRDKEKELETEFTTQRIDQFVGYLNTITSITSIFDQQKTNRENAELERDRQANDKKQRNLESRLRKGLITQQQYDREMVQLQQEQEKKEKEIRLRQFKRDQRASFIAALISGAEGIAKTIATNGMPKAIPFLIAQAAIMGAQLTAIASQKPPEFARGGKLGGRSHADGGNPILDGSGRKIAEIEAGEGIINKRSMGDGSTYTVTGTVSQIASRINALHGGVSWAGGAHLRPAWKTYQPAQINYPMMRRMYADGGTFNAAGANSNNDTLPEINIELVNVIATLNNILAAGIQAKVLLTQLEDEQDRLATIRDEATMR